MQGLLRRLGRSHLPLILHPDAWRDREIRFPDVTIHMPPPSRADIEREGIEIREERAPTLLVDRALLVTGQVERTTSFEPGLPVQYALVNGTWERDAETWDDQGIVVHVRGKGLVVLSSCSHAGVINILRNARTVTGVDHLHAFVGGLHLTGAIMEPLIPRTLDELATLSPDFLVAGHCTGWRATHELSRRFPSAYLQTGVGTRLRFEGQPA
jgi:7,8-dihydropterin-6-yl-methyl-4-(beta-D-ribofuranosyl)aminobenzene 5'-phosphate synthase